MFSPIFGGRAGTVRKFLQVGNLMAQRGRGAGEMLGDFYQRAGTRSDSKPANERARLRCLPGLARRLERAFGQPVALAHMRDDLFEGAGCRQPAA